MVGSKLMVFETWQSLTNYPWAANGQSKRRSELGQCLKAVVIICNRGELSILLQLGEHTVHRHQSDIVRVQANNHIGWGVVAVVVQNCLMIYMIWSSRGEDNSKF